MYDSTIFDFAVGYPGRGLGSTALDEEKEIGVSSKDEKG